VEAAELHGLPGGRVLRDGVLRREDQDERVIQEVVGRQLAGNRHRLVEGGSDGDVEAVRGHELTGADGLDVDEVEVRVGVAVPQCCQRRRDEVEGGRGERPDPELVVHAAQRPRQGAVGGPGGLVDASAVLSQGESDRGQPGPSGPARDNGPANLTFQPRHLWVTPAGVMPSSSAAPASDPVASMRARRRSIAGSSVNES
jgi:hypothetical protein